MEYLKAKAIISGGIRKYMADHPCGYKVARAAIDELIAEHPQVGVDIRDDAELQRLIHFERRWPGALREGRESNPSRSSEAHGIAIGAVRDAVCRLDGLAERTHRDAGKIVRQVVRIAIEQGPLERSNAGRPRAVDPDAPALKKRK